MSDSLIRSIKQGLADVLLADAYFAGIPVMPIIPNDVLLTIQQGQYEAHPLTVLIDWLSVHNSNPDTPGPWFNQGIFLLEVLELPSMNIGGPDVDAVAENVANAIHLQPIGGQNVAVVESIAKHDNDAFARNSRVIRVSFPFGFKPRVMPQIAPVVISPLTQGNQTVTLSCVTPGAAIFYTLDGSYPGPNSATARIFAPTPILGQEGQPILSQGGLPLFVQSGINVVAGQLLKARAWLYGFAPTQPAEQSNQY